MEVRSHIGYADQNGHPYRSMGRALINAGELTKDSATMQGIKSWANKNKKKLKKFLDKILVLYFLENLIGVWMDPLELKESQLLLRDRLPLIDVMFQLGPPYFLRPHFQIQMNH